MAEVPIRAADHQARADGAGQVMNVVRRMGRVTISELSAAMGLSRSTIVQRLDALETSGLIETITAPLGARGRPAAVVAFNSSAAILLVGQLGITGCRLAVTDLAGEVLASSLIAVDLHAGPVGMITSVGDGFESLVESLRLPEGRIAGVGIGMPSAVELLSYSRSLGVPSADWDRSRFRVLLGERFAAPVFVDLDVNLLALAERRMSWPDVEVFVCLKLGTLIDASIVVNDVPVRGVSDGAGGLGHIKIMGSGESCTCGGVGCLDAVASGSALVRQLRAKGHDVEHVTDVVRLVTEGHPDAVSAVRDAGKRIGEALSTVVNLLNPAVISAWGYLTEVDSVLFAGIREGLYQTALPRLSEGLHLAVNPLGDLAGVRGAALYTIDEILDPAVIERYVEQGSWLDSSVA